MTMEQDCAMSVPVTKASTSVLVIGNSTNYSTFHFPSHKNTVCMYAICE